MGVHREKFARNYIKDKINLVIITQIILSQIILSHGSTISQYSESNLTNTQSNNSKVNFQNEPNKNSQHFSLTGQEINSILHQFDEIDNDLESLETIFSLQSKSLIERKIRSLSERPNTQSINSKVTFQKEPKKTSEHLSLTGQEINSILHQFDEIDKDLETLETIFSLQSKEKTVRKIRSLSGRPKCTISKDKLTNLKMEIENILSHVSSTNQQNTCTLNLNDPDNCNELTKVIQCGIQHLKNGFVESTIGTIDEILKWKQAYESLLDKYEKESDNLKQALSQEYQFKLDKLQTDLQNLGKSLNTAFERLQTIIIDLCVSKIMLGKIQQAVEHSKELKSTSIGEIIKQSYNFQNGNDKLKNFEQIINFIQGQSQIDNDKIAYETLYNEMESKNDLNSLKVVLLAYGIRNSPAKDQLKSVYAKIENNYLNKTRELWENILRYNGKDVQLKDFAENYHTYFTDHLSELEKGALKGILW